MYSANLQVFHNMLFFIDELIYKVGVKYVVGNDVQFYLKVIIVHLNAFYGSKLADWPKLVYIFNNFKLVLMNIYKKTVVLVFMN